MLDMSRNSKLRKNELQNFGEKICKAALVIFDMT